MVGRLKKFKAFVVVSCIEQQHVQQATKYVEVLRIKGIEKDHFPTKIATITIREAQVNVRIMPRFRTGNWRIELRKHVCTVKDKRLLQHYEE